MATVTGLTAERMIEIENASIVSGEVIGDDLVLERFDGTTVVAGDVRGPKGDTGAPGAAGGGIQVVTSGTRPGSPPTGLMIYETDTKNFYVWDGTIWSPMPPGVIPCTSGTRPASPYTGMYIFESDTGTTYVYSGGWKFVSSITQANRIFERFQPAANRDVNVNSMENWTTETLNITVPPWATTAIITSSVSGHYSVSGDIPIYLATSFNGVDGTSQPSGVGGTRGGLTWIDQFTGLTPGNKTLRPRARKSSGTGPLRADTLTNFMYTIEFGT